MVQFCTKFKKKKCCTTKTALYIHTYPLFPPWAWRWGGGFVLASHLSKSQTPIWILLLLVVAPVTALTETAFIDSSAAKLLLRFFSSRSFIISLKTLQLCWGTHKNRTEWCMMWGNWSQVCLLCWHIHTNLLNLVCLSNFQYSQATYMFPITP